MEIDDEVSCIEFVNGYSFMLIGTCKGIIYII